MIVEVPRLTATTTMKDTEPDMEDMEPHTEPVMEDTELHTELGMEDTEQRMEVDSDMDTQAATKQG